MNGGAGRRLFLAALLLYLVSAGGWVLAPDGVVMARVTQSLVEEGDWAVRETRFPPGFLRPGRDGRLYAKYAPGLSLAAIPFYVLGKGLAALEPADPQALFGGLSFLWYRPEEAGDGWIFCGLSLTNAVLSAGVVALLFRLALAIGYTPRAAFGVSAVAAVASPLWPYAKTFFAEPLAALALMGFALAVEGGNRMGGRMGGMTVGRWFTAGLCLGSALLARPALAVLLPLAAGIAVLAASRWRPRGGGRAVALAPLAALGALAAGLVPPLAFGAWANAVRFGSALATGYGEELSYWSASALEGAAGLLWSPGRGLLVHFPAVLLAAALVRSTWRRSPHWTLFTWAGLATLVLFLCRWHGWDGGWCWGPRFLLPLVPFLALGTAPFWEGRRGGVGRPLGWAILIVSALVAFSGTLVPFTEHHQALRRTFGGHHYLEIARWSWAASPPWSYWSFSPKNYWLAGRALAAPGAAWLAGLLAAVALLAAAAAWSAARLCRGGDQGGPRGRSPAGEPLG